MTKLPDDKIKYGEETTHGSYHKFCKYCETEFTSEILAKEHLFSCAYDEVILPMPGHKEPIQYGGIGYGTETTYNTEPIAKYPLYRWITGEITLDDLGGGYTHEIVKPKGNWIITDKGAKRIKEVTQLEEYSVTWELTEKEAKQWKEFIDVDDKVIVTVGDQKFECTYEYDEETGILHLEGEEIKDAN